MSSNPRSSGAGGAPRNNTRYTPAGMSDAASSSSAAGGSQKIDEVQNKLNSVRSVMADNMQRTLDRGQQLEEIEQKSDVLLVDANKFQESAAATKRMFCRRHARNIIICVILAAVFLGLIIYWASK